MDYREDVSFDVSPATAADYPVFLRLFAELGVPEGPPSSEKFASVVAPGTIFLRERSLVVGYAFVRPRAGALHVVHLVTDPAHRRRGVARALMLAIAARARASGFVRWMLNVKPDNAGARALYEACGMHVSFASVSMLLRWGDLERFGPPRGAARELLPPDDAPFEQALGLPAGEISAVRNFRERVLLGVDDAEGPAGYGAFDVTFPGLSPFYVRSPAHLRALLDAVRLRARHDHVRVFVEDNAELERVFELAGAEPVLRVLRMEGDVPDVATLAG